MTTIEYLKREIHRTELSIRQAHRKPNTPLEEIEGLCEKLKHMQEALEAVEEHWQRVHSKRGWMPRLNREAWEPCAECKPNCMTCVNNWEGTKSIPKVCSNCVRYSNYKPEYKYCYECGRPLTEEAWAEMERRVFGEV